MKKIIAALGLAALVGCSNTSPVIAYCVQPNGITIPQACSKDLTKEYKIKNKNHEIRVYELDRNKDQKTDLVFLLISNKNGALMTLIEDKNFDGLVDNTYVDLGSKDSIFKPDKIYDWKVSAEAVCEDLFSEEANEVNLRFNSFLKNYLDNFD
ncbi:MAG: hypothetical protein KKF52_02365 [Nanoarchaeota archaeon]|nr:hypothetical protein [Nanoarchaeota archaeon]MBU4242053.1 hypothetical protein [Nanoarchaeota archaeon]MBU4352045.1 hypothetical protein [Nanoarchaeota archaeon]